MKLIDTFNVKHGDFGVYHDIEQDYVCVLDCGTSQPNSCLHTGCLTPKRIINFVSHRISSSTSERDILISHYHQDHFNGISAFKKYGSPFFRNMYVPYMDFKADYTKQFLYSMCLLKATSDVLRIPFTLLQSFSSLFLEEYAKKYIRCHRGHSLREIKDSNGAVAEVLWPPSHIYNEESKELKRFIDKLEGALRKHELRSAIEKTEKYLSELQEHISSREFSSLDSDNQEQEKQEDEDKGVHINEIFTMEEYNEGKGIKGDLKEIKAAFSKLRGAVKTFLNALSIVLRIDHKIVWMGDVTEEVLRILKKDLNGKFMYFKLPHHGTIDITNLNLRASKFVVSLSDGKNFKPINKENLKKALNDNTIILCTDGHRYCHNNGFPFYCWDYLPSEIYSFFEDVYCSRNMVVRIDL